MSENLIFSKERAKELNDRIIEEFRSSYDKIFNSLNNNIEIDKKIVKKVAEQILIGEKSDIVKIIEKQRRFEEESFRVHADDYRFFYFEYLVMMFADLGDEGLEVIGLEIKFIDEEIVNYSKTYDYTSKALAELYLQAYEIVKGILYLCKYGLGNNAFSLWRTLFEVASIFLFIYEENSQKMSRKFLIHSIYKAEFQIKRDTDFSIVKRNFEKEFNSKEFFKYDYEWADGFITRNRKGRISFTSLYKKKFGEMEDYYKEACNYTHSTIFRNIKRYSVSEIMLWTTSLMDTLYLGKSKYLAKLLIEKSNPRYLIMYNCFHLLYEEMGDLILAYNKSE